MKDVIGKNLQKPILSDMPSPTTKKNKSKLNDDLKIEEGAGFVRCVDFITRMIEKYSHELT